MIATLLFLVTTIFTRQVEAIGPGDVPADTTTDISIHNTRNNLRGSSNETQPTQILATRSRTLSQQGSFTTLAYNVAGLPEFLSSADTPREESSRLISTYINSFDVVHLQEDFNYHAAIYDYGNNHPYRTSTTGGVPFGNGLNDLSRFQWLDFDRQKFSDCNGFEECLANKGFHMKRIRLEEGVYVDMFNTHFGAKSDAVSIATRRKQAAQMLRYIEENSAGNSILIFGDLNSRWTRQGDPMDLFQQRGFRDVWVDIKRGGDYPRSGTPDITCEKPQITSPNCEVVDKVLYLDNGYTNLEPMEYELRLDATFTDGRQLSDHPPVFTRWRYSTPSNLRMTDPVGGPHGRSFNGVSFLPSNPKTTEVVIRAGRRVDAVEIQISNGYRFRSGGWGGSDRKLTLQSNEYIVGAMVCTTKHNGTTRIGYLRLSTNTGRSVEGGRTTSSCQTFAGLPGWGIVGYHGRSGSEIDKIGFIFAPFV